MHPVAAVRGRSFIPRGPSLTLKDLKINSLFAGLDDADLGAAMLNLNFGAGDLLMLFGAMQHFGSSGISAQVTEGTHAGWNPIRFLAATFGGGEDAIGICGLWKIAAGNEGVVDMMNAAGAAGVVTNRHVYAACSYAINGTPSIVGTPTVDLTGGLPPSRTISMAGETDLPALGFSWAIGNSSHEQNFNVTPDQDSGSYGGGVFARLKTKIYTTAPANIVSSFPVDTGTFNGQITGYFQMVP